MCLYLKSGSSKRSVPDKRGIRGKGILEGHSQYQKALWGVRIIIRHSGKGRKWAIQYTTSLVLLGEQRGEVVWEKGLGGWHAGDIALAFL